MKQILLLVVAIYIMNTSFSQDVDFYLKDKNHNYSFPTIPEEMTFQEFNLLSHDFRMQDMLFSVVVPGYTHFKAQENMYGYSLVAVRTVAFSTLAYEYIHFKNTVTDTTSFIKFFRNSGQLTSGQKVDAYVVGISLATIGATYLFDIIHGKYILQKKQEKIRFKYSPRISLQSYIPNNNYKIGMNLGVKIYF